MPKSVRKVCRGAFSVCAEIENIEFSRNLDQLEERTFEICGGLKKVTLPYTMKKISKEIFYECNALCGIELITDDKRVEKLFVPYEPRGMKFIREYKGKSIDFEKYDAMFKGLKKYECKIETAFFRLKNHIDLSEESREKYVSYLKRYSKKIILDAIKKGDIEKIGFMGEQKLIAKTNIEEYIKASSAEGGLCTGYFIDYRNRNFTQIRKRFVL